MPCRVRQGGDSAPRMRGVSYRRLGIFRLAAGAEASQDIAQAGDILDFCVNAKYKSKWPGRLLAEIAGAAEGRVKPKAITSFRRDRKAFQRLAATPSTSSSSPRFRTAPTRSVSARDPAAPQRPHVPRRPDQFLPSAASSAFGSSGCVTWHERGSRMARRTVFYEAHRIPFGLAACC